MIDLSHIPISETAEVETASLVNSIQSISSSTANNDTSVTVNEINSDVFVEFRLPHCDHKHPSSIKVDINATKPRNVFCAGKYDATMRFETIGQRNPTYEKLERLYDGDTNRELRKKHRSAIDDRKQEFSEAVHDVSKNYDGIKVYVDTGDSAFSGNDYRPHVRTRKLNMSGEELGKFLNQLVERLSIFYESLPHDRFCRT